MDPEALAVIEEGLDELKKVAELSMARYDGDFYSAMRNLFEFLLKACETDEELAGICAFLVMRLKGYV
jgi:hypothetical protein